MGLPIQSSCNTEDPEEHALWALVALPGVGETAPMAVPEHITRKWSKRLWDCGFRFHPELQTIKYVPPGANTDWVSGVGGRWTDIHEELPAEVTAPDTSHLSLGEKQVLLQRLSAELAERAPENKNTATVENGDT